MNRYEVSVKLNKYDGLKETVLIASGITEELLKQILVIITVLVMR